MTSHFLFLSWLVPKGFDLLVFDYRGYGASSKQTPTQKALIEDAAAVFIWVKQREEFASHRIFIVGQSLGGAVLFPALRQLETKKTSLVSSSIVALAPTERSSDKSLLIFG